MNVLEEQKIKIEKTADKATRWIGSTSSIILHTIIFVIAFTLPFFGISFDRMLLVLTTVVSLEAIYLSIFIQMSVNKNTADIEEIQEDVGEIQKDVDEIQEDVDEIQGDIGEDQESTLAAKEHHMLTTIQDTLKKLSREIENLKK